MAELATIARPYAEALFRSAAVADANTLLAQVQALAAVADRCNREAGAIVSVAVIVAVAGNTEGQRRLAHVGRRLAERAPAVRQAFEKALEINPRSASAHSPGITPRMDQYRRIQTAKKGDIHIVLFKDKKILDDTVLDEMRVNKSPADIENVIKEVKAITRGRGAIK